MIGKVQELAGLTELIDHILVEVPGHNDGIGDIACVQGVQHLLIVPLQVLHLNAGNALPQSRSIGVTQTVLGEQHAQDSVGLDGVELGVKPLFGFVNNWGNSNGSAVVGIIVNGRVTGAHTKNHQAGQQQSKQFFHFEFPPYKIYSTMQCINY